MLCVPDTKRLRDKFIGEHDEAYLNRKVCKRPLNKKELAKKEDDIATVSNNAYLTVHEPKLKKMKPNHCYESCLLGEKPVEKNGLQFSSLNYVTVALSNLLNSPKELQSAPLEIHT